jgi:hypothetical protein
MRVYFLAKIAATYAFVVFIFSLSLQTANKAMPQAPRITPKEGADVVKQNKPDAKDNKTPSDAPLAPPQQSGPEESDAAKNRISNKEPERPIAVTKLPNVVVEKDRYDYIAIGCTFLLFIVGASGVYIGLRTLKNIQKQTYAIRRQAVLMRRST